MRKPSDQSLEDKRVYVTYKSITEGSQDRNSKTEFEGRLASYSISATLTKKTHFSQRSIAGTMKDATCWQDGRLILNEFSDIVKDHFLKK